MAEKPKIKRRRTKYTEPETIKTPKPALAEKPLNSRQNLMLKYYFQDIKRNKYAAYKKAGYKSRGSTGRVCASQAFAKDNIKAEIEKREGSIRLEAHKDGVITFEWIIERLKYVADFDLRKLFNEDGNFIPIQEWPDEVAKGINMLDLDWETYKDDLTGQVVFKHVIKKVRASERLKALDQIADLMRMKDEVKEDPEDIVTKITEGIIAIANSIPVPTQISEKTAPVEDKV